MIGERLASFDRNHSTLSITQEEMNKKSSRALKATALKDETNLFKNQMTSSTYKRLRVSPRKDSNGDLRLEGMAVNTRNQVKKKKSIHMLQKVPNESNFTITEYTSPPDINTLTGHTSPLEFDEIVRK